MPQNRDPAPPSLSATFPAAMLTIYQRARAECHYNATRFLGMVSEHGGVETARRLICSDTPSEGYVRLWESGRLDLTVEALVLRPEFAPLFTAEELARARAGVGAGMGVPPVGGWWG